MRPSTLLLVALFAGGCAPGAFRPSFFAPPAAPKPAPSFFVRPPLDAREATLMDGAVTATLEIPRGFTPPLPVAVAFVGNRDPVLRKGIATVSYRIDWERFKGPEPPAPAPENSVGIWVLQSASARVLGWRYLNDIVAEGTIVIPHVLDWVVQQPEIDPERIGIVGVSTSGFVALQATATDSRIGTAAILASCGDYPEFLRRSSMGMQGRPLDLEPTYRRWLARYTPSHHPRRLAHAAILLVNRTGDELIPASCAQETIRRLRPLYERAHHPERLRFVLLPEAGHGLGNVEHDEYLQWLDHWLLRR